MHDYTSPKEARQQLRNYMLFYNHQRLHQSLDYQTPASVYFHQAVVQHQAEKGNRYRRLRGM